MPEPGPATPPGQPTFAYVYRRYFHDCCRWLRAIGAPDSDLEDLAQEVFLVVRRKLDDEPIQDLAAWLYGIARRTASDHRRRAWWKNLLHRRGPMPIEARADGPGPAEELETSERARLAARILDRLPPPQRAALVLFEVEGLSGREIAALERVPLRTVWTRLHAARRTFVALAERARRAEQARENR